ncbi:MAG: EamA family transporter, partial [Chloroflexi bacterium]|nr:EamA family transporter [Chloroflexota bacterium]
FWGSAFVAQRVAGREGSVFLFNGARFLLAALILWPFIRRRGHIDRSQFFWMFLAGAVLFVASILQQAGVQYTTAGNAGFITSLYVVIVPLVLFVGWKERPHWTALAAVGLAVGGAFLLSTGGELRILPGDALELIGALFWALHVVLLGKFASRYDALSFSVGQFAISGALNLVIGVFVEYPFSFNLLAVGGAIVYTAVFSVGIGYTLQAWAQHHTPPTDAALILSLESVFAVLSGWLLLDERLAPIQILGCGLILAAVLLAQMRPGRLDPEKLR